MRDILGEGTILGYCTNVHALLASRRVEDLLRSLDRGLIPVRRALAPDGPLAVGLWLPPKTAKNLADSFDRANLLDLWLEDNGFMPYTFNGFPFSDFHARKVKYQVYEPPWCEPAREDYTRDLIGLISGFVGRGGRGSVSTLPIGWRSAVGPVELAESGLALRGIAESLDAIEQDTGIQTTLDLEPEPGCALDTADDVIEFFDIELQGETHRKHIGVCHDICHAAVMYEDQVEVLRRYADAGIRVNKVQISSAIEVDVASLGPDRAADLLRPFDEPRYLHQTMLHTGNGNQFFEDLPEAIAALDSGASADTARVHFHVPIFLDSLGELGTTQSQIIPAIRAARELHDCKHFEVETYAWNVLPDEHKPADLAEGIARELQWVIDQFKDAPLA